MRLRKSTLYILAPAALLGTAFLIHVASTGGRGPRAGDGSPRLHWTRGDVQAYDVAIESTAQISLGGRNLPEPVRQKLAGTLHLRVLAVDDGEARVGFQLAPLRLVLSGSAEGAANRTGDGPPFLATFDRSGRAGDFIFPKTTPPQLREMLVEMVRTFQCVIPRGSTDEWTTHETHSTGDYAAEYVVRGSGTIKKRKTAYRGSGREIVIERSRALFRLSSTSWLERATLEERIRVDGAEHVRVENRTEAHLTRTAVAARGRPAILRLDGGYDAIREGVRRHDFPSARAAQRPPAQKPTREQVRGTVKGLNASDGNDATFIVELRRQIVADPGHTEVVVDAIEAEGTTDGTDAALINVLGLAGTTEAQEALVGILGSSERRHQNRLRTSVALSLVVDPNESTFTGLWQAADNRDGKKARDLSNTALLSLGTATGTLRVRRSTRLGTERARLVGRLGRTDRRELTVVLKALGTRSSGPSAPIPPARYNTGR